MQPEGNSVDDKFYGFNNPHDSTITNSVVYEREDIFWENSESRRLLSHGLGPVWGETTDSETVQDIYNFITNGYHNTDNNTTLAGYPNKVPF